MLVALALVWLLGSAALFTATAGGDDSGRRGARVSADGIYFWHYLHSLVIDGNVNFADEYANELGNPWHYGRTPHGKPRNPATIGPALLWAPFYAAAHAGVLIAAKLGVLVRTDGLSRFERLVTLYTTFLYGLLAILLALRTCRRHVGEKPALWAALGAALGGPLIAYMVLQPSYSHAFAALGLAAFIECWDATRRERSLRGWTLLGGLGGAAMLMRPQLAVAAVLPLCDLIAEGIAASRDADHRWSRLGRLALGGAAGCAAALIAFSPQMLAWQQIHGELIAIPQGDGFMRWSASLWLEALFHPRAGLFPWMPLAFAALAGLLVALRRRLPLAGPLLLLWGLVAYTNGAVWDWWGGWSYGARRFTSLYPLLALGLALLLEPCLELARRHARAVAVGAVAAVLALFCLHNLAMMRSRHRYRSSWYDHRQFYTAYVDAVRDVARDLDDHVGNPASWPANLLFAWRYGTSADRYDRVAARYFLDTNHPVAHSQADVKRHERLVFSSPGLQPFLASGFSKPRRLAGRRAVAAIDERADLLLPVIERPELRAKLVVRAARPKTLLEVRLAGRLLLSRRLSGSWETIRFEIAMGALRRGINRLSFVHRPPERTHPSRRIGTTGVRSPVDLAAYSRGARDKPYCELRVDGELVSDNRRGLNVVSVDPKDGSVLDARGFDLHFWRADSELWARWVERLERGTIVAVAVRKDAGRRASPAAIAALRALGVRADLRDHEGAAFAAVGVKGARPGQALEKLDGARRVVVVVGDKPDSWRAHAYYDRLELEVVRDMPP